MADPWDIPLPIVADYDESPLYEALGRAVDRWEHIEWTLSMLYSLFVGDHTFLSMREYGANGNIFRDRLAGLERAADAWFVKNCNQSAEGEFNRLMVAARGFSDRRNEFAHGVVANVAPHIFWRCRLLSAPEPDRYLVVPPIYIVRKYDEYGLPTFGFSSFELEILHNRMQFLELDLALLMDDLWPRTFFPPEWRAELG
ncbi:MAG: hypothetical protein JJ911_00830 [Rhizobiaceae bacterium]|nr:hypothetical protein [Rhizobiaceae bacterium]